jgi:RecA/RadA recombinase
MTMKEKVAQAKAALLHSPKTLEPSGKDYLSSGVTLINLASYGTIDRGIVKGKVYRIAGRSSSGKTFLCRTILAEAARNKNFDGYELIYDDVERGALMDTEKFFGRGLVDRLVPPAWSKSKVPIFSRSTLDFYRRVRTKLEDGKKLIWVLDSLDSLCPDAESKMTDGKAKVNSQELRKLMEPLETTGSILILISQTRVDMRSMFPQDIAAGGNAPEFYSTLEIWLRKIKILTTTYKEKKCATGILVSAHIKKNRISGKDRKVTFPFSPDYGIDDVGANIDFIRFWKHWEQKKGIGIIAPEFEFQGTRNKLIKKIEEENSEQKLQIITEEVWNNVQKAITVERKPRYS